VGRYATPERRSARTGSAGWLVAVPYVEPGTWQAYERDGRLRLLPVLGELPLGRMGLEQVREAMDRWIEKMETEELAPKTVNNTLGTLVVCLNAALEDGLIASNPALRVRRLPGAHIEREYLRLHEIPLSRLLLRGLPPACGDADRQRLSLVTPARSFQAGSAAIARGPIKTASAATAYRCLPRPTAPRPDRGVLAGLWSRAPKGRGGWQASRPVRSRAPKAHRHPRAGCENRVQLGLRAHLTNVYRKLGISARSGLADILGSPASA
jgi:hypothetical protein